MRITGDDWFVRINGSVDKIVDDVREEFYANADEAVALMKEIISNSSTPTGLARGTNGRIDSGTLIDSVKVLSRDKRKYFLDVSFGFDPKDFEGQRTPNYALIQDNGFVHVPDGAFIPGMHALQDARAEFLTKTTNTLNRMFR